MTQKRLMLVLGLVTIIVLCMVYLLSFFGVISLPLPTKNNSVIKTPSGPTPFLPQVSLKEDYQNPFDKKASYINPFTVYRNPFNNLK